MRFTVTALWPSPYIRCERVEVEAPSPSEAAKQEAPNHPKGSRVWARPADHRSYEPDAVDSDWVLFFDTRKALEVTV
jgi:hypothetical protein